MAEEYKDYAVWNHVNRARDIISTADTVTVEVFRDAMFWLDKAIAELSSKGKKV